MKAEQKMTDECKQGNGMQSVNGVFEQADSEELLALDGAIGKDKEWDNADPKVLYIALAPNIREKDIPRKCFWIQEVVYGCVKGGGSIVRWLIQEQRKIAGKEISTDEAYQMLKKAAFMNLSKRGCKDGKYENCVKEYLQNEKYRANTIEQIKSLNPDIIVCYDSTVGEYVDELLQEGYAKPEVRVSKR